MKLAAAAKGMGMVIGFFIFLTACSSKSDNPETARRVAETWVSQNIDDVSGVLADAVTKDFASFLKPPIAYALRNGIEWEFYPTRIKSDTWRVTAHATNLIDLSMLNMPKAIEVSGDVVLAIDTANQNVEDFRFNMNSINVNVLTE